MEGDSSVKFVFKCYNVSVANPERKVNTREMLTSPDNQFGVIVALVGLGIIGITFDGKPSLPAIALGAGYVALGYLICKYKPAIRERPQNKI